MHKFVKNKDSQFTIISNMFRFLLNKYGERVPNLTQVSYLENGYEMNLDIESLPNVLAADRLTFTSNIGKTKLICEMSKLDTIKIVISIQEYLPPSLIETTQNKVIPIIAFEILEETFKVSHITTEGIQTSEKLLSDNNLYRLIITELLELPYSKMLDHYIQYMFISIYALNTNHTFYYDYMKYINFYTLFNENSLCYSKKDTERFFNYKQYKLDSVATQYSYKEYTNIKQYLIAEEYCEFLNEVLESGIYTMKEVISLWTTNYKSSFNYFRKQDKNTELVKLLLSKKINKEDFEYYTKYQDTLMTIKKDMSKMISSINQVVNNSEVKAPDLTIYIKYSQVYLHRKQEDKVKAAHDKLVTLYNNFMNSTKELRLKIASTKEENKIKDNYIKFKILDFCEEIGAEAIYTRERLLLEGSNNSHCVGGYFSTLVNSCSNGYAIINYKRFTITIDRNSIIAFAGYRNNNPSQELRNEFNQLFFNYFNAKTSIHN